MADPGFELDVFRDVLDEASVIAALAKDEKAFRRAHEAFRESDREAFQSILKRLRLLPRCRLVCEWIRSKECVFLCLKLAGPPKPFDKAPDPRQFAEAVVRLTSDEKTLKLLSEVVEAGDRDGFERIVDRYKLQEFRHLFCHWVCVVRYRLICRWICGHELARADLALELQSAGHALERLLGEGDAFAQAVAASDAGDAQKLGTIINTSGLLSHCHFVCEWFCSWRCTLACFRLVRQFPIETIADEQAEAFAFAVASGALAGKQDDIQRASAAIGAGNEKAFATVVQRLKLQRFGLQFCHWICGLRCYRFCSLVCPVYDPPLFTHVGDFGIYGDISPATGLTNTAKGPGAGHGGPGFGFFGNLTLGGFCPKRDASNSEGMAYRFLFQPAGAATPTPIAGGLVTDVLLGTRNTTWNSSPATQSVWLRSTGVTDPTPPPAGPGLFPPDHHIVPDPQGWVIVDQAMLGGVLAGPLMKFVTPLAVVGGDPTPGVAAGMPIAAADLKHGVDAAIIFQATRISTVAAVNGGAAPDHTNTLGRIHINNWNEVGLLDLLEFQPGACTPLSSTLTINYTTDHELMRAWSIGLSTAATIPPPPPVFPSGPTAAEPRGSAGSDPHTLDLAGAVWPPCSYLVSLATQRKLTDGINDDPSKTAAIKTFCISRGRH